MSLELPALYDDLGIMARRLASQWPGVDAEDIQQEMALKVAENLPGINERAQGYRVEEGETRKLALGLAQKRGLEYCSGERSEYQRNSAQWIYTPTEVRALLPNLWDGLAWEDAPKRPSRGKEYLEADGISILLMDMKTAYEALPEQHQATILSTFRNGDTPGLSSTERMRVTRAVDAMTELLNREVFIRADGDHEGPGSRRVLTNATARFLTTNDLED